MSDYRYYRLRDYLAIGANGDVPGLCAEIVAMWRCPTVVINDRRYRLALLHLECDPDPPTRDLRQHVVLWQPGSVWAVDIVDCRELADPMSDLLDVYPWLRDELELAAQTFYCRYSFFSSGPKPVNPLRLEHVIWREYVRKAR